MRSFSGGVMEYLVCRRYTSADFLGALRGVRHSMEKVLEPAKKKLSEAGRQDAQRVPPSIDASAFANNDRNLRELAYERVLDMLLGGEMPAGTPLQERRLAEILNISRTPVREALRQLEAEGLVMRQMGRLMTVRQVSVQDYIEVLNVRKLLEVEAAGLAAGKVSKATAEELRKAVWDLMEEESPSAARHWQVDDLLHYTIAEAANNKALTNLIRDLRRRTHVFNTRRIPGRRRPGALEHLALIDAIAIGDADKARAVMGEHIENVKSAIIEQVVSKANRPTTA